MLESNDANLMAIAKLDDRNVFGTIGLSLSATARRKIQSTMLPLSVQVWQLIKMGDEESLMKAEDIVKRCLPRNAADLLDERYFGIYYAFAEIALIRNDKIQALENIQLAIEKFPQSVRRNHIGRLIELGVNTSVIISSERSDGLSETDAAAVLQQIHNTISKMREKLDIPDAVLIPAAKRFAQLEHGDTTGHSSRPATSKYL